MRSWSRYLKPGAAAIVIAAPISSKAANMARHALAISSHEFECDQPARSG